MEMQAEEVGGRAVLKVAQVGFNSLLEMPAGYWMSLRNTTWKSVSILYWRCSYPNPHSYAYTDAFQFSIGDATYGLELLIL